MVVSSRDERRWLPTCTAFAAINVSWKLKIVAYACKVVSSGGERRWGAVVVSIRGEQWW